MLNKHKKMEDKQTIIDRWEKIGFLKGLDDKQKEIASLFFENIAIICSEFKNKENYEHIEVLSFLVSKNLVKDDMTFDYLEKDYLIFLSRYLLDELFETFNLDEYKNNENYSIEFAKKFSKDFIIHF